MAHQRLASLAPRFSTVWEANGYVNQIHRILDQREATIDTLLETQEDLVRRLARLEGYTEGVNGRLTNAKRALGCSE